MRHAQAIRRTASGYVLLAVLLFVGLIGTLSATYLNHVMLVGEITTCGGSTRDAGRSVDSGVAWAAQALLVNQDVAATEISCGTITANVETGDLSAGHHRIFVRALDSSGIGATLLAEGVCLQAADTTSPTTLPHISADLASSLNLNAAVPKTHYSGTTLVHDVDLVGLVVIHDGARVSFDNVTITGCLVSQRVLAGTTLGAWNSSTAPTVIVDGGLRVTPSAYIAGVAVLMPDGALTSSTGPSGVQLMGDVVAGSIALSGTGSILGNIACVQPLSLSANVGLPGAGRTPRNWASSLKLGDMSGFRSLAVVPRRTTVAQLPAITGFHFP